MNGIKYETPNSCCYCYKNVFIKYVTVNDGEGEVSLNYPAGSVNSAVNFSGKICKRSSPRCLPQSVIGAKFYPYRRVSRKTKIRLYYRSLLIVLEICGTNLFLSHIPLTKRNTRTSFCWRTITSLLCYR
jgi:hypothetical protein